ncbi:hypothetical protein P9J64_05835 [Deltaproteobacteria bacterium IMCC39524]|nr:hypothetical protein [Deltaproteobacteria bacterium IMCC39524]
MAIFTENKRYIIAFLVVMTSLSWLPYLLEVNPRISFGDEGVVAQGALRIFRGEIPYKDFFISSTPGVLYWTAIFFEIFGPTFLALRLSAFFSMFLVLSLSTLILWRVGVRNTSSILCVISFLAFFGGPYWFIASHHWVSNAFCLMSLLFLLTETGAKHQALSWFLAGATGGLAALTIQHKGFFWVIFASAALLLYRQECKASRLLLFWAGVLVVMLPVLAFFSFQVGPQELFYDLVSHNLLNYNKLDAHKGGAIFRDLVTNFKNINNFDSQRLTFNSFFNILVWNVGYVARVLVHLLPFFTLLALIAWIARVKKVNFKAVLLICFFGAFYFSSLHRIHETTFVFAAPSALLLLVYLKHNLGYQGSSIIKATVNISLVFATIVFCITAAGFELKTVISRKTVVATHVGNLHFVYPNEAKSVQTVVDFFSDRLNGEYLFAYKYLAFYYFLLDAKNPTPYDLLVYPASSQEQLDRAESLLKDSNCRWILWDMSTMLDTSIGRYIATQYAIRESLGDVSILERKYSR